MSKIVNCGCSWAYGFYWQDKEKNNFKKNKSYTEIYAEQKDLEYIDLSLPGGSNYCIAKQVEYAIKLQPKIIVFNTTTDSRIDLRLEEENNERLVPSLSDFRYGSFTNDITKNFKQNIWSSSDSFFKLGKSYYNDEDRLCNFLENYNNFIDLDMRMDQNKFLLHGVYDILQESNILFVCIDMTYKFSLSKLNVISVPYKELIKSFPTTTDEVHFNQEGHHFIAKKIHDKISKNKI